MRFLENASDRVNHGLSTVAGVAMLAMMSIVVLNVVLRLLRISFVGVVELLSWVAAVTVAFGVGYTQVKKGHVAIELLTDRLSPRWRLMVRGLVQLCSTLLFGFATWRLILYAGGLAATGVTSESLQVAFYPFTYLTALGVAALTLALVVDTLRDFASVRSEARTARGRGEVAS